MSEHTPGPFDEAARAFVAELMTRAYGPGPWVPKLEGDLGTWKDWESALVEFAERIAAPDLLVACKLARRFGSTGDTDDGLSVSEFLRAAITKAEGRT